MREQKKQRSSLAKTLAVVGGATAAGVGTGVLTRRLLHKLPKNRNVARALAMALPPAVTIGLLLPQLKKRELNRALESPKPRRIN